MEDVLLEVERWFASQCDGSWEHQYGFCIETLDNPGWQVTIDLSGTQLRGRAFDELSIDRTETDWLRCRVCNEKFEGFGGPENLRAVLLVFLDWAEEVAKGGRFQGPRAT